MEEEFVKNVTEESVKNIKEIKEDTTQINNKCRKCGGDGYKRLSYLHYMIICSMCGGSGKRIK